MVLDAEIAALLGGVVESGEYPSLTEAMAATEGIGPDDTFETGLPL